MVKIGKVKNVQEFVKVINENEILQNYNYETKDGIKTEKLSAHEIFDGENYHAILYDKNLINDMKQHMDTFLLDGTFSAFPVRCGTQMVTIMIQYCGTALPIIWGFLNGKKTEAYVSFLQHIKNAFPFLEKTLKTTMCDYERAIFNAISEVFPDVRRTLCYFHQSKVCIIFDINFYSFFGGQIVR